MNKLTFDTNNGNRQVWEQCKHNGKVQLYNLEEDWEMNNLITITPVEMVMLSNMYREVKRLDISDTFINPEGQTILTSGDSVTVALKKQIPKKPNNIYREEIEHSEDVAIFGVCPCCNNEVQDGMSYCSFCGQALDWEATK